MAQVRLHEYGFFFLFFFLVFHFYVADGCSCDVCVILITLSQNIALHSKLDKLKISISWDKFCLYECTTPYDFPI